MNLSETLAQLLDTSPTGWDIALAAVVTLIGWLLGLALRNATVAVLRRLRGVPEDIVMLIGRVVKYAMTLLAASIALSLLGASLQPLLTTTIVVALVIGLALRGVAANFAAGVVIQTRRAIKLGDHIRLDEHEGRVSDLNGRSVVITTRDGRTIHIPNEQILQRPLVNYSEAGRRRSEMEVRVRCPHPPQLQSLTAAAIASTDGVSADRGVSIVTSALSDDRTTFRARFWHEPGHDAEICSAALEAVAAALHAHQAHFSVQAPVPAPPLTSPTQV